MIEHPETVTIAGQIAKTLTGKRIASAMRGNTPHKWAGNLHLPDLSTHAPETGKETLLRETTMAAHGLQVPCSCSCTAGGPPTAILLEAARGPPRESRSTCQRGHGMRRTTGNCRPENRAPPCPNPGQHPRPSTDAV